MQGELATFELSKAFYDKGFRRKIGVGYRQGDYYNSKGELNGCCLDEIKERKLPEEAKKHKSIPAPTLSVLQKWLREVHNIVLLVDVFDMGWLEKDKFCYIWRIYNKSDKDTDIYTSIDEFKTYEEAFEEGLQVALKLIN